MKNQESPEQGWKKFIHPHYGVLTLSFWINGDTPRPSVSNLDDPGHHDDAYADYDVYANLLSVNVSFRGSTLIIYISPKLIYCIF